MRRGGIVIRDSGWDVGEYTLRRRQIRPGWSSRRSMFTNASDILFDCGLEGGVVIETKWRRSAVLTVSSAVSMLPVSLSHR